MTYTMRGLMRICSSRENVFPCEHIHVTNYDQTIQTRPTPIKRDQQKTNTLDV